MFPCLRARETLVAEAKFASREGGGGRSKNVQEHFASTANVFLFARRGNVSGNNVSATVFSRLRTPLDLNWLNLDLPNENPQ